MPKTKIIATLGPASNRRAVLRRMMQAGLDVVRLNFSHASHNECLRLIRIVRELNKKYRRRLRIMGDLEGPRIRIGRLPRPVELKKGQIFWLTNKKAPARKNVIPFDYPGRLKDIRPHQIVYLDDGNLALEVVGRGKNRLKTRVLVGGTLLRYKGVNLPGAALKFGGLSSKDRRDIAFCLKHRLDFIAQSFVQSARDIQVIRQITAGHGSACRLVAKIENGPGVADLDRIIAAADGAMVARGDLGVSLPIWEVPLIQKEIIRKCRQAGRFSITATQMLESMKENLRPERAEVSDVANAVFDGSDYLMLSAETSVGRYPVEAVRMMDQIIKCTERFSRTRKLVLGQKPPARSRRRS